MSDPPKTPPELDAIARVVLAYKPKAAKAKVAKKRKKASKLKPSKTSAGRGKQRAMRRQSPEPTP